MMTTTTDDCLSIDVKSLNDYWRFNQRRGDIINAKIQWSRNGNPTSSIGYILYLDDNPRMKLHFNWQDKPQEQIIPLATSQPHYGGTRWWFVCPFTHKRCTTLYSPHGQPHFAARTAFKHLPYGSQHEKPWYRALRRYHKLCEKYGADPMFEGYFPRPKGMHQKTYENALNKLQQSSRLPDVLFFTRSRYSKLK